MAAKGEGLDVEWTHADMREIPAGARFDAVINVFTSFGYYEDDSENEHVVHGVARALAPGGAFLIDTFNLLALARRYRERDWEERDGGVLFLQQHRYDLLQGRNNARWTFVHPDGRRSEITHSFRPMHRTSSRPCSNGPGWRSKARGVASTEASCPSTPGG
jgi:SAM-dependent methyltransferase